jgi:hypothetical protein
MHAVHAACPVHPIWLSQSLGCWYKYLYNSLNLDMCGSFGCDKEFLGNFSFKCITVYAEASKKYK